MLETVANWHDCRSQCRYRRSSRKDFDDLRCGGTIAYSWHPHDSSGRGPDSSPRVLSVAVRLVTLSAGLLEFGVLLGGLFFLFGP